MGKTEWITLLICLVVVLNATSSCGFALGIWVYIRKLKSFQNLRVWWFFFYYLETSFGGVIPRLMIIINRELSCGHIIYLFGIVNCCKRFSAVDNVPSRTIIRRLVAEACENLNQFQNIVFSTFSSVLQFSCNILN